MSEGLVQIINFGPFPASEIFGVTCSFRKLISIFLKGQSTHLPPVVLQDILVGSRDKCNRKVFSNSTVSGMANFYILRDYLTEIPTVCTFHLIFIWVLPSSTLFAPPPPRHPHPMDTPGHLLQSDLIDLTSYMW